MPIDVIAKITSTATFTSVIWRGTGSSSSPNNVVSVPKGTTANAANAAVTETIGAIVNRKASAAFGRSCSFRSSLKTSANGCSRPAKPTRFGPLRSWM
jgi:hypothetical protein